MILREGLNKSSHYRFHNWFLSRSCPWLIPWHEQIAKGCFKNESPDSLIFLEINTHCKMLKIKSDSNELSISPCYSYLNTSESSKNCDKCWHWPSYLYFLTCVMKNIWPTHHKTEEIISIILYCTLIFLCIFKESC